MKNTYKLVKFKNPQVEFECGIHSPLGANERPLLPTIEYVSTSYCKKFPMQHGVTMYYGLLFRWWRGFIEIRITVGKLMESGTVI